MYIYIYICICIYVYMCICRCVYCAELRSFRRGCMALRSRDEVEFKADVTAVILYVFVLATVPWSALFMEHKQCRGSYGHFFCCGFFRFRGQFCNGFWELFGIILATFGVPGPSGTLPGSILGARPKKRRKSRFVDVRSPPIGDHI